MQKRSWIIFFTAFLVLVGSMTAGYCQTFYAPTYFASDKEALEVLQSLKGSFAGWSNYPKQTVEIDKYGLRLFSEYMGTKKVWNTWEMYYMTVPDLRSENAILVFKNVSSLKIAQSSLAGAVNPICVTQDNTVATTFCMKNEATARRFADAVATLSAVAGGRWVIDGGYTIPSSEGWFRNKLGWKKETGAVLKTVLPGGPFDRAGIQSEDIVVEFGGQEIKDSDMLWKIQQGFNQVKYDEVKVMVKVFRRGTILEKEVVYVNHSAKAAKIQKLIDQPVVQAQPTQQKPKLGATIRALTDEEIKTMNFPSPAGVLVTGVDASSTAQRMNLMINDVILEVNGIAVKDIGHLQEILTGPAAVNKMKVKRGDVFVDLVVPVSI